MLITLILFALGSSIASFLSVIVIRLKRSESIIVPRSHCDYCQTVLKFWELIPVFSYLALRGKCRKCSTKISRSGFVAEVSLGSLFVLSMSTTAPLAFATIFAFLTLLTLEDLSDQQMYCWETSAFMILASIISPSNLIIILSVWGVSTLFTRLNYQEKFIGNADIELVLSFFLILGLLPTLSTIFIGCVLALGFLFSIKNYQLKLPFIPFLSVAFILNTTIFPLISGNLLGYKKSIEIISRCFN